MSELVALSTIDRVDRERARLHLDADRLEAALREAHDAAAARRTEADAARAARDALRVEERAAERRIDELNDKKASATRVLETGAGDPAAAQRQIDRCAELLDEAETTLLTLMEQMTGADAASAKALQKADASAVVAATSEKEMPPRIAELRAREAAARGDLEGRLVVLPVEIRERYHGLRDKGRWPVARLKAGKCDACSMTAPPQTTVELNRGRLLECHGCKRWLLPEEV